MIEERAPAKLNLALHVRARRPDGYHAIETLFAFVRDGDTIRLDPDGAPGLTIDGPFAAGLAADENNLVLRAERLFAERVKPIRRAAIYLEKRLPVASGIGGGSADAAATLRALARIHGIAADDARLFDCADRLGSDVPACLLGRAATGRGRGERLEPLPLLPPLPVLLVNPGVPVSTAAVFRGWDGVDRGPIADGDALAAARDGRNDLEPSARAVAPVVDRVLARLAAQPGAGLTRMSGSGATCFALFEDPEACRAAGAALSDTGWWCLETALT